MVDNCKLLLIYDLFVPWSFIYKTKQHLIFNESWHCMGCVCLWLNNYIHSHFNVSSGYVSLKCRIITFDLSLAYGCCFCTHILQTKTIPNNVLGQVICMWVMQDMHARYQCNATWCKHWYARDLCESSAVKHYSTRAPQDLIDNSLILVHVKAWGRQATSHFLIHNDWGPTFHIITLK